MSFCIRQFEGQRAVQRGQEGCEAKTEKCKYENAFCLHRMHDFEVGEKWGACGMKKQENKNAEKVMFFSVLKG